MVTVSKIPMVNYFFCNFVYFYWNFTSSIITASLVHFHLGCVVSFLDCQFLKKMAAAAAKSLQSCPTLCNPTRLPRPWDSPGKNTGVGCHCLLQCMKVKSENEVAQSCPTLHDPMNCSPPCSSVLGIFQAGVLEWGAIAFSEKNGLWIYHWETRRRHSYTLRCLSVTDCE